MNRRHFISHIMGMGAISTPAINFTNTLLANAADLKKNNKNVILLWMSGGPSTIDIWDLKPGQATGGIFRPINTSADGIQICEHLPMLADQMHLLNIVRNMSTREADHTRGRYYMHTGYVPNPNIEHPSYGSIISHELIDQIKELDIPAFVSVGGASIGPGFLGMTYAPFVVNTNGTVRDLDMGIDATTLSNRLKMLETIENRFVLEKRGQYANDHRDVLSRTVKLMNSPQMDVFKVTNEPEEIQERYGKTGFGRSCLMARRLVEMGVPFIEVDFGGWDNHADIFTTLPEKLSEMDKGMSTLIQDLNDRGLLDSTAIIWMGEFGRTPNINGNAGRDHWAKSWSVVVGGANFNKATVVGATTDDGKDVDGEFYTSQDLMASVLRALDISLETTFTAKNGRPMKIANSGKVIKELF
jgi:hypothetical protein